MSNNDRECHNDTVLKVRDGDIYFRLSKHSAWNNKFEPNGDAVQLHFLNRLGFFSGWEVTMDSKEQLYQALMGTEYTRITLAACCKTEGDIHPGDQMLV